MCKCNVSATYNSTKLVEEKGTLGPQKEGELAEKKEKKKKEHKEKEERKGMCVWRGQPGWELCKKQSFICR